MHRILCQTFNNANLFHKFTRFHLNHFMFDVPEKRQKHISYNIIMKSEGYLSKIDVFNLDEKEGCTKQQLLDIRNEFISVVKQDTCPECSTCEKMLSKIVFVYHQNDCYCIDCFESIKYKQRHAFVFIDLDIKDHRIKNWNLSEELELLHLTHEFGVEDTQLLAESMTIPQEPKTSKDIQYFYEQIQAAEPLSFTQERGEPYVDIRKEKWFKMYHDLKDQLEQSDTHVLDFILGELHEESDEKLKNFALEQFQQLTQDRAKMYGMLEKLAKQYSQRYKHPKRFFSSSSSDSQSLSELSLRSDSASFQQIKARCTQLLSEVDTVFKLNSKQKKNNLKEQKKGRQSKHVTFVEEVQQFDSRDQGEGAMPKTKRITRNFQKKRADKVKAKETGQLMKGILKNKSEKSQFKKIEDKLAK